ncbi:putative multi-drug efflux transporter [Actinoplanes cyaneus]|uniref:Multi-drug efflux transporter n=1 Tax=Actinoplanes cyaneus TaxID=52696 RepID=A0A919IC95_9ACTN|nr:MFS transporter [Actinoplanes cyaneus]MCW2136007.1 Major Facilitator Superfamily protein [Actinoplanes cyaneus]GID62626.1 putative multi-drug efflux transporter [Actinoplanes cyaneus]
MTTTAAPAEPSATRRLPHGAGFRIIALAFGTELAFCAVPTPLYAIYQQRDGFPTIVLTVIFAAYAVGVMLSLYLAGHVSDRLGRRRVILGSLLLNLVAALLFLVRDDVAGLIVARFVSGLGVGVLTATATAYLAELGAAAGHARGRVTLVSTFANLGGIGLGPLIGGFAATWSPRPLVTPYVAFAVLLAVEGILVAFVPETVERRAERHAYRPQRVAVPAAGRGTFWAAAAAAFGAFAVFGTFMGLSSTFLVGLLGRHSHLLAGLAPFVVFMAAALAQVVTARMATRPQIGYAIGLATLGLGLIGVAAVVASLPLFLAGGGVAGAGIGILFRAALGTVAAVADAERRGEALAGVFLVAYAGMTVPPLLTAAALRVWPTVAVLVGLVTSAAILVAVSGSRMLRR